MNIFKTLWILYCSFYFLIIHYLHLDAGSHSSLFAHSAGQFPARRGNVPDAVDGLQEDCVGEPDLGDPETTDHVRPATIIGLFEGTASVGTQATLHRPTRRLEQKRNINI